jgi:hypothetical protein
MEWGSNLTGWRRNEILIWILNLNLSVEFQPCVCFVLLASNLLYQRFSLGSLKEILLSLVFIESIILSLAIIEGSL